MRKSFHLEIVTPERCVYKGEAVCVSLVSAQGSLTILANHAPLVTDFIEGPIRFTNCAGRETIMVLCGGFVEVSENQVAVLDQ